MSRAFPVFETSRRGLDREQVRAYMAELHEEHDAVESRAAQLEQRLALAEAERHRLETEITRQEREIEHLSQPVDSVEGMSDRIARMMRVASDEARQTKQMAEEEARALTSELKAELESARRDRETVGEELANIRSSTAAQRDLIVAEAKATAEEILQNAHREKTRVAEEDEARRREAQRRLDTQIKSAWEQAEGQISARDNASRVEAARIVAAAEREAAAIRERTEAEVAGLVKVRSEVVGGLTEIQSRIEAAVRREKISVVRTGTDEDR